MYASLTTNLMVNSVEDTIGFYESVLGFSVVVQVPSDKGGSQFAILKKDAISLMIQEKENFIAEYPVLETADIKPSISLYITVNDFDSVYMDVKGKCEVYKEVHQTVYGTKEFAITDINGYVLTITEHAEM